MYLKQSTKPCRKQSVSRTISNQRDSDRGNEFEDSHSTGTAAGCTGYHSDGQGIGCFNQNVRTRTDDAVVCTGYHSPALLGMSQVRIVTPTLGTLAVHPWCRSRIHQLSSIPGQVELKVKVLHHDRTHTLTHASEPGSGHLTVVQQQTKCHRHNQVDVINRCPRTIHSTGLSPIYHRYVCTLWG